MPFLHFSSGFCIHASSWTPDRASDQRSHALTRSRSRAWDARDSTDSNITIPISGNNSVERQQPVPHFQTRFITLRYTSLKHLVS